MNFSEMSHAEMRVMHAELGVAISNVHRAAKASAIAQVQKIIADDGLTAADVFGAIAVKALGTRQIAVAPKYRKIATGETWAGRGKRPKWLQKALAAGATLEDFAVTMA